MKQLMILMVGMLMFISIPIFSQTTQNKTIMVSEADLPDDFLAKLKAENELKLLNQKIETYGRWVGVGEEVGTAIKGGLMAVKDVSVEFAQTDLGIFTMVLVAWKVVGRDIVGIIFGIIMWMILTLWTIKSYFRTCTTHKILVNDPGFGKYPKEYKTVFPIYPDGGGAFLHAVVYFIGVGIVCIIMFA